MMMNEPLRLMAVLAHPDDESLGAGGTLAYYAARGVHTYLLTATRGERGRFFDNADRPDDAEVGRVREGELRTAAAELGIREVSLLGYGDGGLADADPVQAAARIAAHLRRVRPHVVLTFGFDGAYGHPDHIAISQLTGAAIPLAADASFVLAPEVLDVAGMDAGAADALAAEDPAALAPHRVAKLYWIGWPARLWDLYQSVFKKLVSVVDGEERQVTPWPQWALSSQLDAGDHWETVWRAVQCHRTQMAIYGQLGDLTEAQHRLLWGEQYAYRVFSTVNGGRSRESDLFEGVS
jgi:LmbE family N-acetylglucosaminyl deacetylase